MADAAPAGGDRGGFRGGFGDRGRWVAILCCETVDRLHLIIVLLFTCISEINFCYLYYDENPPTL